MNQQGETSLNQRGEYSARYRRFRPAVSLGVIGVGVAIGLAAWPGVRQQKPFGFIAMGASGSMVAVGLTELLFSNL